MPDEHRSSQHRAPLVEAVGQKVREVPTTTDGGLPGTGKTRSTSRSHDDSSHEHHSRDIFLLNHNAVREGACGARSRCPASLTRLIVFARGKPQDMIASSIQAEQMEDG
jgi:hypothetical protein